MMVNEKIKNLRKKLKENNIDAYYITGSDAHLSEYVAPHWRTRAFISGFTGSAGVVLITEHDALLWVDSRYFIQAASQIEETEFKMLKLDTEDPSPEAWMKKNLDKKRIGVEESEISINKYEELRKEGIDIVKTNGILDSIWEDRPSIPDSKVVEMPLEYAGKTSEEKIEEVRKALKEKESDWTFITSLDDIAWLTNLRADDIPCNPVFYSFFLLTEDDAVLFTNKKRFSDLDVSLYPFKVEPYEKAYDLEYLKKMIKGRGYYDGGKVSSSFLDLFSSSDIKGRDITTDLKAIKNKSEIEGMRRSHLEDGVAFVNFLAKVEKEKLSDEIAISDALEKERERRPGHLGPSFNPISAFSEHGAMCHYSATEESNKKIDKNGLLVLDTGGMYEFGMTDITRTLLFGAATDEEKRDYTLVLKGHLALSRQRFIKGTRGVQLDVLAKQYLWQYGESFYHGTGHGVGCRLNVHEGPMNISSRMIDVALEPGMIISDEPGVYKEGRHGIRIENLILVKEDIVTEFGTFYSFEVLTLVPYEKALFDLSLLTDEEIDQINLYHKRIYEALKDKVDEESREYLISATSPISRN